MLTNPLALKASNLLVFMLKRHFEEENCSTKYECDGVHLRDRIVHKILNVNRTQLVDWLLFERRQRRQLHKIHEETT